MKKIKSTWDRCWKEKIQCSTKNSFLVTILIEY